MFNDLTPDLIRQVKRDDFLPDISLWTTLGGFFLVGTVGAVITLANLIKYNVTVKASAIVRPSGEVRLVQATTEGAIKTIQVKDDQMVKKGDVIATIDDSQLQIKKSQLQGNIQQSQLQQRQIDAQLKALQTQVTAETNSTQRSIASAQADKSRNQRDYQDRQITAKTEVQEAEAALDLAKEELKRYQQLGNTGAIATLQIKEKEQVFKAAFARFQRTKAGLNPSGANVVIAQERIAQEQARGESTLATLNKEKQELIRHQIEIKNQVSNFQKELKQVQNELQKSTIRTTESGTILKLELRNSGQVVRSGDAIAQISPVNAPLIIKARVAAQDIAKVKVCKAKKASDCGQGKVQLRVSAYPYPDYGVIIGSVRAISTDVMTPQTNLDNLVAPYYEVTIQSQEFFLQKNNQYYFIKAGMEIDADIVFREETVLTFILKKARLLTDV